MKKLFLFSAILVGLGLVALAQPAEADTYPSKAGDCWLVDQRSEADSTHVYTLNHAHTIELNMLYYENWRRNARCDELQFHVDHNTSKERLDLWLKEVAWGWYQNIGVTHFNHQTVSTSRHEWFYIDESGAHKILDWPTQMSWGMLLGDRISIPTSHTEAFYDYVTIGAPLSYTEGTYFSEVQEIWDGGIVVESSETIPQVLLDEINDLGFGAYGLFLYKYPVQIGTFARGGYAKLLDFNYAATLNPLENPS